jgi:ferredoxin
MKVTVDTAKCIAAGVCVMEAMEVFDQRDEDGVAILLDETPGEETYDGVREAAAICPAAAIRLAEK